MAARIMLLDDDLALGEILADYLGRYGMELHAAARPTYAFAMLSEIEPELLLLDALLPERCGLEICREMKARRPGMPVLLLTPDGVDPGNFTHEGAGCLAKPFAPREALARIHEVLRGASLMAPAASRVVVPVTRTGSLRVDALEIDAARVVRLHGQVLTLTPGEAELLKALAESPGSALHRDELEARLKEAGWDVRDHTRDLSLDMLVGGLRTKLGDDAKRPRFIKTVWGTGYMLAARVEDDAA